MRGFTQNRQIGTALPLAVMNRIRRQNGGYLKSILDKPWSRGVFASETCRWREVLGAAQNSKAQRQGDRRRSRGWHHFRCVV